MSGSMKDWQPVAEVAKRFLGDPNRGCPDCGAVAERIISTGQVAYSPGTECCLPAVERQIAWRNEEVAALQKRRAEREAALEQIRAGLDELPTRHAREAAEAKLERAERNLSNSDRAVFAAQIQSYSAEIKRLRAKAAALSMKRSAL